MWALLGFFALLYLLNRNPHVGFNDGLSFLASATGGFDLDTNATSHFLYNNLLHLLATALGFLPPVLVLSLFSIACSLCTLLVVHRIARLLTPSPALALLPVVALGISFTFWQQTEIIEVYAFNTLIFAAFLWACLRDILAGARRHYLLASLLLGLGLLTHIQHILSIPFFLVYLWWGNGLPTSQRLLGMLPWMALMSVLFILPMALGTHSLRAVFFESKFQDELLGLDVAAILKGCLLGAGMLAYNFQLALVPVGMGWRRMWRQDRRLVLWLLLLAAPYLAFAMKYAVNDNHVFYLCSYVLLLLPLTRCLPAEGAARSRALAWMLRLGILLPVATYAVAPMAAMWSPKLRAYDDDKAYKGGLRHLLWPGKASAPDPLDIAYHAAYRCEHRPGMQLEEWNLEAAVAVLHWECRQKAAGKPVHGDRDYAREDCFFDCPDLPNLE